MLSVVDGALASGPPTDLVLLPEASLSGYLSPDGTSDLRAFAEPLDGDVARALASLARAHRTHLVGPLVERDGNCVYNAMIGFRPDGARFLHYRKRHPWHPEAWATAGVAPPPVVDVAGYALTIAVCFDVHFLADESAVELHEADVLLFPSAWVEDADSRSAMLPALAQRFEVAIVNANWGPGLVRVPGQGGSRVYGADGAVLAASREGQLRVDAFVPRPARGTPYR
jgi:predicted amidohydrolase